MRQIVVISGKGGTGKTVITGAFAALAKNKVMADCDVDAADLHLLLGPEIKERYVFKSGVTAVIDNAKCTQCGKCIEVCRFEAIYRPKPIPRNSKNFRDRVPEISRKFQGIDHSPQKENRGLSTMDDGLRIDPISCEGCAFCSFACPVKAIEMEENTSGEWFISDTRFGPMVHAKLGVAEENSGKLVALVRQRAEEIAEKQNLDWVIVDGAPGIGCPVIASITGVNCALVVTEPTLSGLHDADRVIRVAKHFGVPVKLVVNKYDLNLEMTEKIEEYCRRNNISFVGKVGFNKSVVKAMVEGKTIIEYSDNEVKDAITRIWDELQKELK